MTYKIERFMYFVRFEEIPSVKRRLLDHGFNDNDRPFEIGTSNTKVLTFDTKEKVEEFLNTLEIPDDYDLTKHLKEEE